MLSNPPIPPRAPSTSALPGVAPALSAAPPLFSFGFGEPVAASGRTAAATTAAAEWGSSSTTATSTATNATNAQVVHATVQCVNTAGALVDVVVDEVTALVSTSPTARVDAAVDAAVGVVELTRAGPGVFDVVCRLVPSPLPATVYLHAFVQGQGVTGSPIPLARPVVDLRGRWAVF